jgi:hypothetical protein
MTPDTDGDGLDDNFDACPQAAADTDDGCPVLPVYLGRLDLGEDSGPDRYLPIGTPARKPQRLTRYTYGADAVVRVHWDGWGKPQTDGRGAARRASCSPARVGGSATTRGADRALPAA